MTLALHLATMTSGDAGSKWEPNTLIKKVWTHMKPEVRKQCVVVVRAPIDSMSGMSETIRQHFPVQASEPFFSVSVDKNPMGSAANVTNCVDAFTAYRSNEMKNLGSERLNYVFTPSGSSMMYQNSKFPPCTTREVHSRLADMFMGQEHTYVCMPAVNSEAAMGMVRCEMDSATHFFNKELCTKASEHLKNECMGATSSASGCRSMKIKSELDEKHPLYNLLDECGLTDDRKQYETDDDESKSDDAVSEIVSTPKRRKINKDGFTFISL